MSVSVHRTPELTLDGGTWRADPRNFGWLCHEEANKIWDLDGFEGIRICVSSDLVPGAVRFDHFSQRNWDYVRWVGLRWPSALHERLSNWLTLRFSQESCIWAWIEEA